MTGRESRREQRRLPGFDGRGERTRAVRDRVRRLTAFEASSAPLEHLIFTNKLVTRGEHPDIAFIRADAGFQFRGDCHLAQVAGLSAKPISDSGGGGQVGVTLADTKLLAMDSLGRLRDSMGRQQFSVLERVVWLDNWLFTVAPAKSGNAKRIEQEKRLAERNDRIVQQLLCCLDAAAVHYGLSNVEAFRARWPEARFSTKRQKRVS